MQNIKEMVKNKSVTFVEYKENELFYKTECGFIFPVPISDTGKGVFLDKDKAITYMRWIRRHLDLINTAKN